MISAEQIKKLREETNASVLECKKALESANGDEIKARAILAEKSQSVAEKKSTREIKQGLIEAYIHANSKVGVLIELGCETDFVAKNEQFKQLAKDLCMHIAAMSSENVDSLQSEQFIKDPSLTIQALLNQYIMKLGENIKIAQFVRFSIQ